MKRVMLDTNTASYIIKPGYPNVLYWMERAARTQHITMSAVTQGELIYGLALKAFPKPLTAAVTDLLNQVTVLPWSSAVADTYGRVRAWCRRQGLGLGPLDMMIAAHAIEQEATLVTSDTNFHVLAFPKEKKTPFDLKISDWTVGPK